MIIYRISFELHLIYSYKCDVNITELITLEDAMNEFSLGPNGGKWFLAVFKIRLLFCMEFLLKDIQWLFSRLKEYPSFIYYSLSI